MKAAAANRITHARLLEAVAYDPGTGEFRWKISTNRKIHPGDVICTEYCMPSGAVYLHGRIDGVIYRLHRLAWFYVRGTWPVHEIDHINGVSTDNRITNLRDVPRRVNQENMRTAKRNSKTGLIGAMPARGGKFPAAIRVRGVVKHLGHFDTAEAAHEAYVAAKRELHEGCTL